jgi:hypothetical protein
MGESPRIRGDILLIDNLLIEQYPPGKRLECSLLKGPSHILRKIVSKILIGVGHYQELK